MVDLDKFFADEKSIDDIKEEIAFVKKFISYIERGYGKQVCTHKGKPAYHPSCINCQSQWALGWLREHQSLIEWELRDQVKHEKSTKSKKSK